MVIVEMVQTDPYEDTFGVDSTGALNSIKCYVYSKQNLMITSAEVLKVASSFAKPTGLHSTQGNAIEIRPLE